MYSLNSDFSAANQYENSQMYGETRRSLILISSLILIALIFSIVILVKVNTIPLKVSKVRQDTVVDKIVMQIINRTYDTVIPTRYVVHDSYMIPASNQANRGTCWAFATVFMLESQYRANGIKKGFLNEDEYVLFSKQAYFTYLHQLCEQKPDTPVCKHGGNGENPPSADDNIIPHIEAFYRAFPALSGGIMPDKTCPYIENTEGHPELEFSCPGLNDAMLTNPIKMGIKSIQAVRQVNDAKELLVRYGRPLGIGLPFPTERIYVPCNHEIYGLKEECTKKTTKCPGKTEEFCYPLDIDARTRDGFYFSVNDSTRYFDDSAHEMDIVGYNDDWVYRQRGQSHASLSPDRGGFVLHNSWTADQGHSVDYLMGRISDENEAVQCPNHIVPQNWMPTTLQCMEEHPKDFKTVCGGKTKIVRGPKIQQYADILLCTDKKHGCDPDRKYMLREDKPIQHLPSGLDITPVISFVEKDGVATDIKGESFSTFPFFLINRMLKPETYEHNDADVCGYWMLPYGSLRLIEKAVESWLDFFMVTDIEFEFDDASYARSPKPRGDTTLLQQSTYKIQRRKFNGPLPYDIVFQNTL